MPVAFCDAPNDTTDEEQDQPDANHLRLEFLELWMFFPHHAFESGIFTAGGIAQISQKTAHSSNGQVVRPPTSQNYGPASHLVFVGCNLSNRNSLPPAITRLSRSSGTMERTILLCRGLSGWPTL